MPAPRRHHLLPQFYLRSFADKDGKVRVVDRATGHEFTTGIRNVFVERDYYTVSSVEAEDDPQLIEALYAKIEGLAAPAFEQLRAGDFPLDGQDRSEFASFMALQVTRGRMFRRWMEQVADEMGRMILRTAAEAPPGYWEARRAEWEANPEGPEPPPRLSAEERQMLREGTAFEIKPSREHVIEMSFAPLEEMTFVLMAMTWRLLVFEEPCLFSSEHPLSYWREPSPMNRMYGIGPATADEVRLPISPSRALVLTPPERGRKLFDRSRHERAYCGDTLVARRLNWGTLSFPPSERLLLGPHVKTHPLPVTVRQMEGGIGRP
jgi:uncharacterized protein DUF4238